PKLYSPAIIGVLGGQIRFQARLSSALAWTVTVANQLGKVVASGTGRGTIVDWTWRSSTVGKGRFTWSISAPGVRPATGSLGIATRRPAPAPSPAPGPAPSPAPSPTFALSKLAASPTVVTPSPDGTNDAVIVSFTLSSPAHVTAQVADATGATT